MRKDMDEVSAFYISQITLDVFCGFLIFLSGIQKSKPHLKALAALAFIAALFNVLALNLINATNLSSAITLSKWHSVSVLVAFPVYFYALGTWSRSKHTRWLTIVFSLYSLLLVIPNFVLDYSPRFGPSVQLTQAVSIFGDPISVFSHQDTLYSELMTLAVLLSMAVLLYFALRFYRQKEKATALLLIVVIISQMAVSVAGYLIDQDLLVSGYLGALPLTILIAMVSLALGASLKAKRIELVKTKHHKVVLEDLFSQLASTTSFSQSDSIFDHLLEPLARYSTAAFAIITEIDQHNTSKLNVLAQYSEKGINSPNTIDALKSPLGTVIGHRALTMVHEVQSKYTSNQTMKLNDIVSFVGIPLFGNDNTMVGVMGLYFTDHTVPDKTLTRAIEVVAGRAGAELRRTLADQKMAYLAYYDELTGLPNRNKVFDILDKQFSQQHQVDVDGIFLLVDVKNFNTINRQFGLEIGDRLLVKFANSLRTLESGSLTVGRFGGDQFALIITNDSVDAHAMLKLKMEALTVIADREYQVDDRRIRLAISTAAVFFPGEFLHADDVTSASEIALQCAKRDGKAGFCLFDHNMMLARDKQLHLIEALREALIAKDQLYVVYQPKVTPEGTVIGAETLLRWQHPFLGFVSPADFIPIAEESGLIHQIGMWVFHTVLKQIKQWQSSNKPVVKISVNVAASQFNDIDFTANLIQLVEHYGVPTRYLEVEITESGVLADVETTIALLHELRDVGISVSLDDFGTGFSSLSYLHELPIDIIKIDKSFIDKLHQPKSDELVRTIIAIGNQMRLKTVAEGTETLEQVSLLTEMGCDYFQGYYFSKPLKSDEFEKYLQLSELQQQDNAT